MDFEVGLGFAQEGQEGISRSGWYEQICGDRSGCGIVREQ